MAIIGFPYVSVAEDRKVTAANEATRIDLIAGSGVIFDDPESFECEPDSGMKVKVKAGSALIAGHAIISDDTEIVELDVADITYPRIDIVVLESDTNTITRGGRVNKVTGTAEIDPKEPALSEQPGISQIKLATVRVPAGATTSIEDTIITDVRSKGTGKHTHPSLTSVNITDAIAPGTARVANIVFGTGSAPTIDSTMPQGTIYIKYLP